MASGFSGGGQDFYATAAGGIAAGRSITTTTATTMNSVVNNNAAPQPPYRSQQQFPGIFIDPSSQISHHRAAQPSVLAGKRTLLEFQAQQQQIPNGLTGFNGGMNGQLLRSVRSRPFSNASTIPHVDFSGAINQNDILSSSSSHRYGVSLLQQMRQQPVIPLGNGTPVHMHHNSSVNSVTPALNGVVHLPNGASTVQNRGIINNIVPPPRPNSNVENDDKMLNQLQELEKQLFDDNDFDEGDAVSVISNSNSNSEWCETIQNIMNSTVTATPTPTPAVTACQKPIPQSPTSSSSSSSPSSCVSVASPVPPVCSKQSVIDAASAIYEGRAEAATEILTRLSAVSNSRGSSEQRLMDFMVTALKSRLNPAENPPPVRELYSGEHVLSTQLLYELSPCYKLGFVAANTAILDAALEQPLSSKLHIIDFDIGDGGQYVNLIQVLATRRAGMPLVVKITALSERSDEKLWKLGDMLSQLASKAGIQLLFNIVSRKLNELSRDSLNCEADEALAVNFAFKLFQMPDESVSVENPRDELLRRVKGLSPRVVTLLEQEWNANTAPFMTRVSEALGYYGALLESIESTVSKEDLRRVKMEEGLSRKVCNSVACEGRDRVERCEVFGKWRARMGMAGFELKPLSGQVTESMISRLNSGNRVNRGFTVKQENGGVGFGWLGRNLIVASAWR